MAYTATVTKQSVTKDQNNIYTVSIKVTVMNGTTLVFERTASAKYNPNAPDLTALQASLTSQLQKEWDKFVSEQGVFNAAAFDTIVTNIQTAANAYVNL